MSITSGKYLRFVGLRVAEASRLSLMPFSDGEDNGFSVTMDHDSVSTSFSPVVATKERESFSLDLAEPKNICVEIHVLTGESHIVSYW